MSPNFPNNDHGTPGVQPFEGAGVEAGMPGYLLRLSAQADRLQARLDAMVAGVQSSGEQLAALTRYLANPATTQRLEERLAEVAAGIETAQGRFDELARQVDGLNGAVTRLARTQFKGNTLAESKDQQVAAALAALQEIVDRREEIVQANLDREQARLAELRAEGRGELAIELLPGLDGLEMALESGQGLLAEQRRRQAEEARSAAEGRAAVRSPEGAWQRLRRAFMAEPPAPAPSTEGLAGRQADEQLSALEGWLAGLELVHERFLRLLALEGIEPIEPRGGAFDPRLHLAVEAAERADVPPGTVTRVLRKGYRLRDRVLRYAEVAVSRAPGQTRDEQAAEGQPAGDADTTIGRQAAPSANEEKDQ